MKGVVVLVVVVVVILFEDLDFSNAHDVCVLLAKCMIVACGLDSTWPEALILR